MYIWRKVAVWRQRMQPQRTMEDSQPQPHLQQQQQQQQQQPAPPPSHASAGDGQCLLVALPDLAMEAIYKLLPQDERRALRLVCKGAQRRLEACARRLQFATNGKAVPRMNKQPLPLRFSNTQHLIVIEDPPATQQDYNSQAVAMLAPGAPWRGVTSLYCLPIAADTLAVVLPALPNLESCRLREVRPANANAQPSTTSSLGRLVEALSGLPKLTSLALLHHAVTDEDLCGLGRCSALTQLECDCGSGISASSWGALAAAPLAALRLCHNAKEGPVQLQLAAVTTLTSLEVRVMHKELAEAATLHPPSSLVSLVTQCTPHITSMMPHLTYLEQLDGSHNTGPCVTEQQLIQLANGCPALRSIAVSRLHLTRECHAARFEALTSLRCTEECTLLGDCQLALVCPNLKRLELSCDCKVGDDAPVFGGMHALDWLHIGAREGNKDIIMNYRFGFPTASASIMAALASLPSLQHLRINAHLAVMPRLSSLTQLTSLSVYFAQCDLIEIDVADSVIPSMAPPCLPPQLLSLEVEFEGRGDYNYHDNDGYEDVPKAVIKWAMHAPHLASVRRGAHGEADSPCASMTIRWLRRIAANPSIQCVDVWGQQRVTRSDMVRVRRKHTNDPLIVFVHPNAVFLNDYDF